MLGGENMDSKKKMAYSEPLDYFPEEIRKEHKLGEYAESETLEDCGGIQPLPLFDETEKSKTVSEDKEAEIKRRLSSRAAEYLMFLDD